MYRVGRIVLAFAMSLTVAATLAAQRPGPNINVLPVTPDALTGDLFLQRQLEPSLAVSTRNPSHLAAFYIDYRTVDQLTGDPNVGEGQASFVAGVLGAVKGWLARLVGRPDRDRALPAQAAAAEAQIGYSRSYDGGLTWSGALLPGYDTSQQRLFIPGGSPGGYTASTDPVALSGPCGAIYMTFIAFNRGGDSAMVVGKWADLDDSRSGQHTIAFKGYRVIETGNNATNGYFNDKPSAAIDLDGGGCGHRVYLAYSVFNGLDKSGKFQSKVNFATFQSGSELADLTASVAVVKKEISGSWTQNQGTAVAVSPTDGQVYVVWRHFFKPDSIIFATVDKQNAAAGRFGKPVSIVAGTMYPFDNIPVSSTSGAGTISFRSNAFPTAAVDGSGKVFVAWQERLGGLTGTPRIVITSSATKGGSWAAPQPADNDSSKRSVQGPAGLGFARTAVGPNGPQFMPTLSFGGGDLMLAYYESDGAVTATDGRQFVAGYNRRFDLRGALLGSNGASTKSFQISRYPVKPGLASYGNSINDIEPVNPWCATASCVQHPRVNRIAPQSVGGTQPFHGDYVHMVPSVQFVPSGSAWKWATAPSDVPWRGGYVLFADNRNLAPPDSSNANDISGFTSYGPYGVSGSGCSNLGSRNTDVLFSRVGLELVITAPLVAQQGPATFPFTVWNNTSEDKFYRLSLEGSLSGVRFNGDAATPKTSGVIKVLAGSSSTQQLYVESGMPVVTVRVTEFTNYASAGGAAKPSGLTGQITFNAEQGRTPTPGGVTGQKALQVSNPFSENPFSENPFSENPFSENPFSENSQYSEVEGVSWTATTLSTSANTLAAYMAYVGIDQAYWGYYGFQLIVSKWSAVGVGRCQNGQPFNVPQNTVVSSFSSNPFSENPFSENPFSENPFSENPFSENPFSENSAFTIAPSDSTASTFSSLSSAYSTYSDVSEGYAYSRGPTEAPRAEERYQITLRAFKKAGVTPPVAWDPKKHPPVVKIVEKNCNPITDPNCKPIEAPSAELVVLPSSSAAPKSCVNGGDPTPTPGSDPTGQKNGCTTAPSFGAVTPPTAPAGTAVVLPAQAVVANIGTAAAKDRVHSYYLVPASCFATYGTTAWPNWNRAATVAARGGDVLPACVTSNKLSPDQVFGAGSDLLAGASEGLATSASLPVATPVGKYRLLVYADSRREVSESNEYNNWAVSEEFTVIAPQYGPILGLFDPCGPLLTCSPKSGSNAVPFAWQFTYDGQTAVDTAGTVPVMRIYASDANWTKGALKAEAEPNNVSSGNSGWQYFGASCLPVGSTSCSRPAYTWQYNMKQVDSAGVPLPAGNYLVDIETPQTKQCNPTPPLQSPNSCPTDGTAKGPVATIRLTLQP